MKGSREYKVKISREHNVKASREYNVKVSREYNVNGNFTELFKHKEGTGQFQQLSAAIMNTMFGSKRDILYCILTYFNNEKQFTTFKTLM